MSSTNDTMSDTDGQDGHQVPPPGPDNDPDHDMDIDSDSDSDLSSMDSRGSEGTPPHEDDVFAELVEEWALSHNYYEDSEEDNDDEDDDGHAHVHFHGHQHGHHHYHFHNPGHLAMNYPGGMTGGGLDVFCYNGRYYIIEHHGTPDYEWINIIGEGQRKVALLAMRQQIGRLRKSDLVDRDGETDLLTWPVWTM